MAELFDLDALDEAEPFEIDAQAAHLFKHPHLGVDDVLDVWANDPLFYPAKPPAHWLMVARYTARSWSSRSHLHALAIPQGADPSAAMRLLSGLATTYRRHRDDH